MSCDVVLGASDYTVKSPGPDAAVPLGPPPELPADIQMPGCLDCARAACDEERERCLEDAGCMQMLRCNGSCSDPACMASCRDEHGDPALFSDYFLCVFGTIKEGAPANGCATACGGGESWDCLGRYSWDARRSKVVVDLRLVAANADTLNPPLNGIGGAEVAWCPEPNAVSALSPDVECYGWTVTDGYGYATLERTDSIAVFALRSRFANMQSQIYTRPVRRSGSLEVLVEPAVGLRMLFGPQLAELSGRTVDPTQGIVTANVTDCLGLLAPARVELERASEATAGCPFVSENCGAAPEGSRWAYFNGPRGRSLDVVARHPVDDRELSRRTVYLYEGWDAHVALHPTSFQ
jgi:hypothetical protein